MRTSGPLSITPVRGIPLVEPGDDLAGLIVERLEAEGPLLKDGDVVVVAQKVISKSEGRIVALKDVIPSAEAKEAAAQAGKDPALLELVLQESAHLMRVAPGVVITRNRLGHVLANAGIDASNITHEAGERALLWPLDPDASARSLRLALEARFGVKVAVIISDSLGRAWRMGTMGTAIGCSGLKPLRDRRGETDLFGRVLQATLIGVADEIAAAASLIIGEGAEGSPVALVRGAVYDRDDNGGIGELLRPLHMDLFQ